MQTDSTKQNIADHADQALIVYWQPGCTSCLKVKEYLTARGVPFRSVNVLEDPQGMADLVRLGLRRVPILARGDQWCDAQVMADINRVAGIGQSTMDSLTPEELAQRVAGILNCLSQYTRQIPQHEILTMLPRRPRSYGGLACHIAEIIDYFLKVVRHGHRLEFVDYDHPLPEALQDSAKLQHYCDRVADDFDEWRNAAFSKENVNHEMNRELELYYGQQTVAEFLERSCWHAGQHLRQLEMVLRQKIGVTPAIELRDELFKGLPMPKAVWDDQLPF